MVVENELRNHIIFIFYGDWSQLNYIYQDCSRDLVYIANSKNTGAPIFKYYYDLDNDLVNDTDKLNLYLRELKIRHYTKKDLTLQEKSYFTFFRFFIKSDKELLIRKIDESSPY